MGIDISQLGKDAQAQVMANMALQEVKKRSKYGNRKVVRDGIKFDSEREAERFGALKVLRAMGKIRDYLRAGDRAGLQRNGVLAARSRGREGHENEGLSAEKETDAGQVRHHDPGGVRWQHLSIATSASRL